MLVCLLVCLSIVYNALAMRYMSIRFFLCVLCVLLEPLSIVRSSSLSPSLYILHGAGYYTNRQHFDFFHVYRFCCVCVGVLFLCVFVRFVLLFVNLTVYYNIR